MHRPLYVKTFHDDAINTVVIYLKPSVGLEHARAEFEKMFGPKYHAFTVSNREIRGAVMRIFDQTFMITYALLGIAIVVAVLGIINTLTALILERTREIALLRVIGMTVAVLATWIQPEIVHHTWIIGAIAVGFLVGVPLSRVPLTAVPQRTALSHAFGPDLTGTGRRARWTPPDLAFSARRQSADTSWTASMMT